MAHYEINGKKIFIDDFLKKQLDRKVIPMLKKKDMDAIFVVDGKERCGKSVFAMGIGGYVANQFNSTFDLSNICLNPLEFKKKVSEASKGEVVIYDEAHRGMGSVGALSEINKLLKDLMMEMGQKNLFVFVVLPTFFLLERYVALFRTIGLFHVYTNKGRRGFWVYFNEKNKKNLFLRGKRDFNYNCMAYPRFRGRFFDQYPVDETDYREKKRQSFTEASRATKEEVARRDMKRVCVLLHEEYDLSVRAIEELFIKHKIHRRKSAIAQDILELSK